MPHLSPNKIGINVYGTNIGAYKKLRTYFLCNNFYMHSLENHVVIDIGQLVTGFYALIYFRINDQLQSAFNVSKANCFQKVIKNLGIHVVCRKSKNVTDVSLA